VAGVGDVSLTADRWGGGARFWTFGILSFLTFAGLYV
jgi:hypothetical protein